MILAFIAGALTVLTVQLVASRFEPSTPDPSPALPERLQTLIDWGSPRRIYFVRRQLPIRVPGATILPEPTPLHTNEPTDYVSPSRWVPRPIWLWCIRKINEISILESDEAFARWWEDAWVTDRKYQHHGRHRLVELREDREWREQHAKLPTAEWPTLATAGCLASEVIAQDVRPMICIGPRLPNGLSSLMRIEPSLPPSTCSSDSSSSELAYVT